MTAENADVLPSPGPVGRSFRLLAGVILLAAFYTTLAGHAGFFETTSPPTDLGLWIGVAITLWLLPEVVNVGWSRNWGHWPQVVVLLLALAAAVLDHVVYGRLWAPPLGAVVFALLAYTTLHLGLSFILAALFAVPG
jgi:hypothetical protein